MQIDLRYKNLEAKRFGEIKGNVNINNNSTLTAVSKTENYLSVGFVFSSNYEPSIGVIRIEGELRISDTNENIEKAMNEWEKSTGKNLPPDIAEKVHNAILSNCIVEATVLSRDVHLPAPIPMPNISIEKKDDIKKVSGEDTKSYIR